MTIHRLFLGFQVLLPLWAQSGPTAGQIEPNAGNWKTWVISSGKDFRVPPPPDAAGTRGELEFMRLATAAYKTDARIPPQVAFWDGGSPGYRWMELINDRSLRGQPNPTGVTRIYTYVAL